MRREASLLEQARRQQRAGTGSARRAAMPDRAHGRATDQSRVEGMWSIVAWAVADVIKIAPESGYDRILRMGHAGGVRALFTS